MTHFGRELLITHGRTSELNMRLATEGVQIGTKELRGEIKKVEGMLPRLESEFRGTWEEKFGVSFDRLHESLDVLRTNDALRKYVNTVAPEAISMLMTGHGKEWWRTLDPEDMLFIQDLAEANNRRDKLAAYVMGELGMDRGLPNLQDGHQNRYRVLQGVLAYEDAITDGRVTLRYLAQRIKHTFPDSNPQVVLDKMGVANERVRSAFDWPEDKQSDAAMNDELARVFPGVLDNANMLSDESRQRLAKRLGVVRGAEGRWEFMGREGKREGERAMRMVVHQRLRNENIVRNRAHLKEVLAQDGPAKVEFMKYGVGEMVLSLFAKESAQDCGRVFQERLRREIINERITELQLLGEQRTPQTVSDEQILRGMTRVGAEIAYFVHDLVNVMGSITTSLLERVRPGGFLAKVLGSAKQQFTRVEEMSMELTNDIPSDVPDFARKQQRRAALNMPDLFAEFE